MCISILFQHCSGANEVHLFILMYISHTFCSNIKVVLLSISYCTAKNTKKGFMQFKISRDNYQQLMLQLSHKSQGNTILSFFFFFLLDEYCLLIFFHNYWFLVLTNKDYINREGSSSFKNTSKRSIVFYIMVNVTVTRASCDPPSSQKDMFCLLYDLFQKSFIRL